MTCKFDEEPIKMKSLASRQHSPRNKANGAIGKALKGNSKVNSPIWPEFKLIWDFMHIQIICKSHEDPIKTKQVKHKVKYGFSALKVK